MFNVIAGFKTLMSTQNLEEAINFVQEQTEDIKIFDVRNNKLIYEWSPNTGLKHFLME